MKKKRILPRGGHGFWWLPVCVGGFVLMPGAFSNVKAFPMWVGFIGFALFVYGMNRLWDFADWYRD